MIRIIGIPIIGKNKNGQWVCKCDKYFVWADTRAIAFAEWKKLADNKGKS
jgi:hypothetical protein